MGETMSRQQLRSACTGLLVVTFAGCGAGTTDNNKQNSGLLAVDCSSKSNVFDNACVYPDSLAARTFGKGPSYKDLSRSPRGLFGGFTDVTANQIVTVGA